RTLAALPFQSDTRALGNSWRNRNFQRAMSRDDAAAAAVRAYLSRADELHLALLLFRGDHSGAATNSALVFGGEFEAALGAFHRVFQRHSHIGTEVGRLLRLRLRAETE